MPAVLAGIHGAAEIPGIRAGEPPGVDIRVQAWGGGTSVSRLREGEDEGHYSHEALARRNLEPKVSL